MATETREKAIQTRIQAGIALEFAEKCDQAGYTQKEVLNRMIVLFNRLGTDLFAALGAEQEALRQTEERPKIGGSGAAVEEGASVGTEVAATSADDAAAEKAVTAAAEKVAAGEGTAVDSLPEEAAGEPAARQSGFVVRPFGRELRVRSS